MSDVNIFDHWTGGRAVPARSGGRPQSLKPATSEVVCEIADGDSADVDHAVAAAAAAAQE
jgi:acyl-CoA reductase-like NAD-dependent aldehyde dehydrogenase